MKAKRKRLGILARNSDKLLFLRRLFFLGLPDSADCARNARKYCNADAFSVRGWMLMDGSDLFSDWMLIGNVDLLLAVFYCNVFVAIK